ncbi:hypothetical protein OKA04_08920 [Luteolibacter flavescens]|uniref:Uncharacterized protein n=1 Tax=Luteolibacter flavescens TaxID=1859460 RepID=A0ABT3FMR0_9BACT|nr:hypothetical protein [Luteolibacter flavescens]MCW1884848.1 hypothetical protein [Luteolibacter flavescens]
MPCWKPPTAAWNTSTEARPMDAWVIIGVTQTALLCAGTVISLMWICRKLEDAAAARMLGPLLILQALCAALLGYLVGMEWFIAHYSGAKYIPDTPRLDGPFWWIYAILFASCLAPLVFLVPKLRRSMPLVTGISLFCFAIFGGIVLAMAL